MCQIGWSIQVGSDAWTIVGLQISEVGHEAKSAQAASVWSARVSGHWVVIRPTSLRNRNMTGTSAGQDRALTSLVETQIAAWILLSARWSGTRGRRLRRPLLSLPLPWERRQPHACQRITPMHIVLALFDFAEGTLRVPIAGTFQQPKHLTIIKRHSRPSEYALHAGWRDDGRCLTCFMYRILGINTALASEEASGSAGRRLSAATSLAVPSQTAR